jgi:hypothetical protein
VIRLYTAFQVVVQLLAISTAFAGPVEIYTDEELGEKLTSTPEETGEQALDVHCVNCAGATGGTGGGDASAANQTTEIARLTSIRDSLAGTLTVSGPITDAQIRALPLAISGTVGISGTVPVSGTFWQSTQPVSLASIPLATGAATSTKQDTGNTSLASIDGKIVAVNTGAVVVSSGTLTANIGTSGSLATEGTLSTIAGVLPASRGQKAASLSTSVVLASDQPSLTVNGTLSTNTTLAAETTKVIGTVNVASGQSVGITQTGTANDVDATITNSTLAVTQSGTWTLGRTWTLGSGTDSVAAVQSGTWNIGSISTLPSLAAGSALVGKFGIDQTTPGTTNKVSIGTDGTVALNAAIPSGSNLVGKFGIDQTTPGTTNKVSIGSDGTVTLLAGSAAIGKLSANSGVNIGSVDVVSEIPGTGATNLGKAEDAQHTSGDVGVQLLGVRTDPTTTSSTSANSDYGSIAIDHVGAVPVAAHPGRFSCFVPITATVTTQCQAAPGTGLRAYVTSLQCSNGAATVQGVDVVFGTGAACATGITALTHKYQMGTNGTTTSPMLVAVDFGPTTPLVPTAANAICVRPTAATAFGCTLTGFIAP